MIRRSPARIELSLEDLEDFDYIQKLDKKKGPTSGGVGGVSAADAQKFVRQERIGFRPIASAAGGSGSGDSGGTGNYNPSRTNGGSGVTVDAIPGGILAVEASTSTLEGRGTNTSHSHASSRSQQVIRYFSETEDEDEDEDDDDIDDDVLSPVPPREMGSNTESVIISNVDMSVDEDESL